MRIDLWQRRIGWLCMVALFLAAGQLVQTKNAIADEADAKASPPAEDPAATNQAGPDATQAATDAMQQAMKKAEQMRANAAAKFEAQQQKFQAQQEQIQKQIQQAQEQAQQQIQQAQEAGRNQAEALRALFQNRMGGGTESGKYWLGLECKEASPELRAQLGFDDEQGLVVVRVATDSPAEKAGLKQHDVIASVDDVKLARVPDLTKATNSADGSAIHLRVFRGGKERAITVTPAERAGDGPIQIIAKPGIGMVMPGNVQMQFRLPDNLEVKIDRKGKEPAKVTIKRGNESWEATSDDLSKLPEDVRSFVQPMLNGSPGRLTIQGPGGQETGALTIPGMTFRVLPAAPVAPPVAAPLNIQGARGGGNIDAVAVPGQPSAGIRIQSHVQAKSSPELLERLEQVSQQLEKTQQELKRLRETIPAGGAPAGEGAKVEKE